MKHLLQLTLAVIIALGATMPIQAQESADKPARVDALKITFLSWATGSSKLSWEHALPSLGQTTELCVGLIGAGNDKYDNDPRGLTLRYGHKFFVGSYDPARPFDGFYLRPEAIYSRFNYTHTLPGTRTLAQMGSLIATVGYQRTWGRFVADVWVGGGYAFGTPAETGYHHGFQLLDHLGLHNDNVALSFSIRVGWCF
ncbi:MAG: hypothetical protein J6R10_01355 [Tidjanibacter sp.]|nr:hypothetical protein [Tidjanibacter sp.]